jgi:HEPN domain-containing protein
MQHQDITSLDDDYRAYFYDYVTRSFVRNADKDYICARFCFFNELHPNFSWAAQQCLEKYLKSILLFQGKKVAKTHELISLFESVRNIDSFFSFSRFDEMQTQTSFFRKTSLLNFLDRIHKEGMNRYGTSCSSFKAEDLYFLDAAVFEFRRYCIPPVEFTHKDSEEIEKGAINKIKSSIKNYRNNPIKGYFKHIKEKQISLFNILKKNNCSFFPEEKPPNYVSAYLDTTLSYIIDIYEYGNFQNISDKKKRADEIFSFIEYIIYAVPLSTEEKSEIKSFRKELEEFINLK